MTQPDEHQQGAGLRRRIVTPAPPAPVPAPRKTKHSADTDHAAPDRSLLTTSPKGETIVESESTDTTAVGSSANDSARTTGNGHATGATERSGQAQRKESGEGAKQGEVVRATGSMAIATLISRITGFIRTVLIGAALGEVVASAFNTANTLPNMITEIVLGSVLTALVVPVLVRAEKEDADHGAAFIRRLFTLTLTLMTVVSLAAVIAAPWLAEIMVDEDSKGNIVQITSFAYLLLPQIFFYGMFSLFMAILNTKEHFRPGAWAPVANNIVSIVVLGAYMALPGQLDPATPASIRDPHVLLLGLGTTLGVVVQCLIMLPALRKLGIDLRPLWGIDERLKQFGGMALAIVMYVAISQLGYVITTRLAFAADPGAPIIYQQHWMLLQMPYGIIGVTLLTAIMPRLSRNAANGDDAAVVSDLTMGTKLTFIALIPIIVFMTALGPEIGQALFGYGRFTEEAAHTLGLTISFSAFTLIPYALVMLHLRVFYAREEAWTPTLIIAGITITKIVLSYLAPLVANSPQHVVVLLGAANGFGFVAGAFIGALLLKRKLGTLKTHAIIHTSTWALGAAIIGVGVIVLLRWLVRDFAGIDLPRVLGAIVGVPSLGSLIEVAFLGLVFIIATGLVLARSQLPEVQNLGRALARIPGFGRFITPDEERAIDTGVADPRDVSTQFLPSDTFNASPVPPPMSAGVVRGPRLVPGASVSDGRFRLIRDHGATTGASFWQAREVRSGRPVALTFVDTTGSSPMAPPTPREAAIEAAGIATRTGRIAKLNHPAIANILEVRPYRTGALIVADWIEGSSVKAVAESGQTLHTEAVANALAPLAGVLAAARSQDIPLGLDNRQRLRIDGEGRVRLAFPAVLPDASAHNDAEAFASAMELLTTNVNSSALDELVHNTRALVNAEAIDPQDFRDIQVALRREANLPGIVTDYGDPDQLGYDQYPEYADAHASPGALGDVGADASHPDTVRLSPVPAAPREEEEPDELKGGFGARRYGPLTVVIVSLLTVISVVFVAMLTIYLVGVFSGNDQNAPVSPDTVQGNHIENEVNRTLEPGSDNAFGADGQYRHNVAPVVIGPLSAEVVDFRDGVVHGTGAADSYGLVGNIVDQNTETTWSTARAAAVSLRPAGVAAGPFTLERLVVDVASAGGPYRIYGLPAQRPQRGSGKTNVLLAEGALQSGQNTIDIDSRSVDNNIALDAVVLDLPADPQGGGEAALETIREVEFIGFSHRG